MISYKNALIHTFVSCKLSFRYCFILNCDTLMCENLSNPRRLIKKKNPGYMQTDNINVFIEIIFFFFQWSWRIQSIRAIVKTICKQRKIINLKPKSITEEHTIRNMAPKRTGLLLRERLTAPPMR